MLGRDLLKLLLIHHRMNPNQLATALHGKVGQPQIHKFIKGDAKEPRRSTLAPIASYFKVPLDAFYDEKLAWKYAVTNGLLPVLSPSLVPPTPDESREVAPPTQLPRPLRPTLREALKVLQEALAPETPGIRRSVVAILSDLAERAEDNAFSDQMIERVLGALGHPTGNASQQKSTISPSAARGGER